MRSEGYGSWVCLSVCLSVTPHLTSGASVRPESDVTYSTGNEGQKIRGVFSQTALLRRSSTSSVVRPYVQAAIFPAEARMRISCIYHVVWTDSVFGGAKKTVVRFLFIMPPSKVCPQCDAVVLIKLKVCKSCQHVFRGKRRIEHTLPGRAMKRSRVALSDSVKSVIKAKDKLQKACKRAAESSEQTLLRQQNDRKYRASASYIPQ